MILASFAHVSKNILSRNIKRFPQEGVVRNLRAKSNHQAYNRVLTSLKGAGTVQKFFFLQPIALVPGPVPANGFAQLAGLGLVGSFALKLLRLRYLILVGGAAGGVKAYQFIDEQLSKVNAFITGVKDLVPRDLPKLELPKDWLRSKINGGIDLLDIEGFFESLTKKEAQVDREASVAVVAKAVEVKGPTKEDLKKLENDLLDQILLEQQQYQEKIEELTNENRNLRRKIMLNKSGGKERKIQFTTGDMYSNILDELSVYNSNNDIQDHLPRIVVVGDQSAGKTSVLEMIAQARIFPRGSGEMMTRSPVQVTMGSGLDHVAAFNDSRREYDLTKESELQELRKEIERRMRKSVEDGRTVSNETISLTVKGPGLKPMVLVDLPGVISTVTIDMASDTKTRIKEMCMNHMKNPNSIILCIQDGSIDAERSIVTDLVSSMDPSGKRTICVMTKLDKVESNRFNPDRIKKIMDGKLFPMKALGYFAVVTGKGNSDDSINDIKTYEQEFFKTSKLVKDGVLKSGQLTTENLSQAVSDRFWKMVRDSVEEEAQKFKAASKNLQIEWDHKFPTHRKMDREEVFTKAVREILDEVVKTSRQPNEHWETTFKKKVWERISDEVINIYFKASAAEKQTDFRITMDKELRNFVDKSLSKLCMEVGEETIQSEFKRNLFEKSEDPIMDKIKAFVSNEKHQWNPRAEESLKTYALEAIHNKDLLEEGTSKFEFMETVVKEKLSQAEKEFFKLVGSGWMETLTFWKGRTPEQNDRRQTAIELKKIISGKNLPSTLDKDQLTALRKNLELQSVTVDDYFIQETWNHLRKMTLLRKALSESRVAQNGGYFWSSPSETKSTNDRLFFKKIEMMLDETSTVLRHQLVKDEVYRFEKKVKDSLEEISEKQKLMKSLLQHERLEIVEKLKHVKQIQDLLDKFIKTLNLETKKQSSKNNSKQFVY